MNTIEEIAELFKRKKSAVIYTHMRPDGDTLGSGMALCRALSLCGLTSETVNEGEIPARYAAFPALREIKRKPTLSAPDLCIAVDTSSPDRLGLLEKSFLALGRRGTSVNIDHHISNSRYAKYNLVRTLPSTAEIALSLISALGRKIEGEIADLLMLGMATDTGVFSHEDVGGETFRAAAVAADGGANIGRIAYEAVTRRTKDCSRLYLDVLSRLRYFLDDRLAVALIPLETLRRFGQSDDATVGIVDFALTVDSVEVSISLLEVRKGQYKASLRSKGRADVNAVARMFGGGGHKLASGCMFFGDIEEIYDKISYAVWQNLGDL